MFFHGLFPPFEIVYLKSAESPVHAEPLQATDLDAKFYIYFKRGNTK